MTGKIFSRLTFPSCRTCLAKNAENSSHGCQYGRITMMDAIKQHGSRRSVRSLPTFPNISDFSFVHENRFPSNNKETK
jgi:hypothetical protein